MAQKKLTKKTLMKSFHHWYYGNLTCFSQEHMQTFGYLTSMLPIVEELYDNKEDQARSMQTYTAFSIQNLSLVHSLSESQQVLKKRVLMVLKRLMTKPLTDFVQGLWDPWLVSVTHLLLEL